PCNRRINIKIYSNMSATLRAVSWSGGERYRRRLAELEPGMPWWRPGSRIVVESTGGYNLDRVDRQDKAPSLLKVTGSVLASFFGVQSSHKHEEDFTQGRPAAYILIGLGATL